MKGIKQEGEENMQGRSTWIAIVVLLGIGLLFLLNAAFPGAVRDQGDQVSLVYGLALLAMVASSVFVGQRGNASTALKQAVAWLGIFIAVIAVYSYRFEFQQFGARLSGEITPTRATSAGDGTVTLYKGGDGHFVVDGQVNGKRVRFLVDTGASDVALSVDEAERIGIDTRRLTFNRPYMTANGMTIGASIRLQRVTVGDITIQDVEASVMPTESGMALLGMSFLNRLDGYEVRGNQLTLKN
jgi:aspartyl protease family protein